MEDDAIVTLYWQRNEEALRASAEKYGSRLRGLAQRILADAHDAEECENDTYLAAWNAIPPHEPRSYLFAFLARITRPWTAAGAGTGRSGAADGWTP